MADNNTLEQRMLDSALTKIDEVNKWKPGTKYTWIVSGKEPEEPGLDYSDLNGSYDKGDFRDLYYYWVGQGKLSEAEFAKKISESDWAGGQRTKAWLHNKYPSLYKAVMERQSAKNAGVTNQPAQQPVVQPQSQPEEKPQLADNNTETQKVAPEAQAAAQMENADKAEEPEVKQEKKDPENKLTSALTSDGSVKAVAEAAKNYHIPNPSLDSYYDPKVDKKWKKNIETRKNAEEGENTEEEPLMSGKDWETLGLSAADAFARENIPEDVLEAVTMGRTPGSGRSQYSDNLAERARINAIGKANREQEVENAANKPKADMAANKQRIANIFEAWGMSDAGITALANHLEDEEMSYEDFLQTLETKDPLFMGQIFNAAVEHAKEKGIDTVNIDGKMYDIDSLMKATAALSDDDPNKKRNMSVIASLQKSYNDYIQSSRDAMFEQFYKDYQSARQQSTQSLSNTAARRNIEGQELSNIYKNLDNQIRGIQSDKEYTDLINGIDNTITSLSKLKLDANHEVNITNFFDSERQLMSIVDGVYMYNEGKSSGLQAGIGFKGASFSGDLSKSQSKAVDALRKANIPLAKERAEGQLKVEKADLDRYNAFIDQQIKDLEAAKKEIQARHGKTSMIPQANPNNAVGWDDQLNKWRTPEKPKPTFDSLLEQYQS